MAETVTKTIENVDKMFSEIVINGEKHESTRYQARTASPSPVSRTTPRETLGEDVYSVELNNVLHNIVDKAVTQIVEGISNLIPSGTTDENQLTNEVYVSDKISEAVDDLDVTEQGGNGKYIKSIKQVNGKIVATADWLSSTGGGVAFIGTQAQYDAAKLIPLGETGHIPSGSLVIITDKDDYLNSEERTNE